jgi:AcrR family transcriptional regulator
MPNATPKISTSDLIIEAALELAADRGWQDLRLHHIAEKLDLSLGEVGSHFQDLDAIANGWFAKAQTAAGQEADDAPPPDRLHQVMMRWFDALAPYRQVTGQMLKAKLYPSHPHHWAPMIFDLSRLIHWFLDAARIESTGRRRQWAEIGLTLIFLATLRGWLRDSSDHQERTRRALQRRLESADRWLGR